MARDYKGIGNQEMTAVEIRACITPDRLGKRQNGRRFKEPNEPMFTLTAQDRHGIAIKEATRKGYAIAKEGDSINLEQPNSTTRRGRVGKGVANTLTTSCNQGTIQRCRIRRLTPKECWRLQGWPDEDFEKAKKALNETFYKGNDKSDSQLYKQAGNGVSIPPVYEIGKRLS